MAWSTISRCRVAQEAEALALLEGVKLAEQWPGDTRVEFKSDCANLVQMTADLGMDRSVILAVVTDIKDILPPFPNQQQQKGNGGSTGQTLIDVGLEDLERTKQDCSQFSKLRISVSFVSGFFFCCGALYSGFCV
jgi:hypothetical protein